MTPLPVESETVQTNSSRDDALGRTATMTKASRTPTMAKGKQNGGGEKKVVGEGFTRDVSLLPPTF